MQYPPDAPTLPDLFRIDAKLSPVPIDPIVEEVLAQAERSPIQNTASASSIQALITAGLPYEGSDVSDVIDELRRVAAHFYRRNSHPGFHGWIASPGLPTDPIGHAMAAALNQNVTGYHSAPGATLIERTFINWMTQLAGLPESSEGLLVSGGSTANLTAIGTALHKALGPASIDEGLPRTPRPVVLATDAAHFSIQRAAVLLGIGRSGVEPVPMDSHHRMRVDVLEERLESLARSGDRRAVCVVATAGTTATGSIDPLQRIAEICRSHNVWLHLDAAYGGAALLSSDLRDRLRGIARADSITIDLHKWCYLAFDGSLLLYRDPDAARDLFRFDADYARFDQGGKAEEYKFFDLSPEVSRRSRALPAYLAFRHYGIQTLGRNVLHNVECAEYLADLVEDSSDCELVARPQLSICCFRYAPDPLAGQDTKIDVLNRRILEELRLRGDYLLSPTVVRGRPVLRVCICSHTTRARHIRRLFDQVRSIGQDLPLE